MRSSVICSRKIILSTIMAAIMARKKYKIPFELLFFKVSLPMDICFVRRFTGLFKIF